MVSDAHIAYGGMAATSRRAALAEAAVNGKRWDEATLKLAMAELAKDYTPLSDMRATAAYRMKTAQNLLRRYWLETNPDSAQPLQSINAYHYAEGVAAA